MNITVIIPVHEYSEQILNLLDNAVESIIRQQNSELPKVIMVYDAAIENELMNSSIIKKMDILMPVFIKNTGKTDYQSQVNLAVDAVNTEYFTVLEFDDEFSISYFKNANLYINTYPEIDIFLTLMVEVNERNEGIKLTNEIVWAQQFVGENGEMGYLNLNVLKQYSDFKLSGAIIKKSEFIGIGRYKSNIKLTFMLEFLFRALNSSCKIFTIPKIGYKHLAVRDDSLSNRYLKRMSIEERKFWFEVAAKEMYFNNDRLIEIPENFK